jgi:cytochrome c oxidase subunit 2
MLAALRMWPLPADAAQHGPALDTHLRLNLWIAFLLLLLAHGLLFAGILWRKRDARTSDNLALEYGPLAVLILLFLGLGLRAQQLWAAERYTGAAPEAMQVEVTGVQFAWYFRYPGEDATFGTTSPQLVAPGEGNPLGLDPKDAHGADDFVSSQLVLPAGREVDITLHAQDVMHGFSVPELRLKQDATPGMTSHIHFTPTTPGDYAILCTQLCGLGHYRMTATVRVLSQEQFDAWLAKREQGARANALLGGMR